MEEKNQTNVIYTHDEAALILELFENLLNDHKIKVPSPEDDEREENNKACLYGSTYSDLLDSVEEAIINLIGRAQGAQIIEYEFSGDA